MKFRIYYADKKTYSGDPFLAPQTGVQVIAQEKDVGDGFVLVHGNTERGYFCWREDEGAWYCTDTGGFWDYLIGMTGPKYVMVGRNIRDPEFWEVVDRAGREGLG